MSLNYDSDDALPRSPGLAPFKPRATPSPSPPPFVTHRVTTVSSATQNASSPSSGHRQKSNRPKTRPSQGDFVLIRIMDPNRPDIARQVGERALNSDSESDADDEEMEDPSRTGETASSQGSPPQSAKPDGAPVDLQKTAQEALSTNVQPSAPSTTMKVPPPPLFHRDSVVELDNPPRDIADAYTSKSQLSSGNKPNSVQSVVNSTDSKPSASSSNLTSERRGSVANEQTFGTSLATSPSLRNLTIPQSRGAPGEKLPALQTPQSPAQDGLASSPSQKQQLPSFRHLSELAETASNELETNRTNGSGPYTHRQSISSTSQSPTSHVRQLSISSSFSPGSAFPPLSATSPVSGSSDIQTRDPFLRAGQHLSLFGTRRPSQASENGPYSATIHSASTNDSYQSSEGLSPGTQSTPIDGRGHRMSIDGALNPRTLPPPVGPSIQHIPSHGGGGYKCEHPGCIAAPFQTQYLLNSHANVHSQSRPHYCPVAGCPRGEGGKGFKRKNEMIRHGLVHASPGYVCPFCPDREHRYPRPDNLQRHVRVHHVDKDKDDPQLREVLAQRPEGGTRGRRRRISS